MYYILENRTDKEVGNVYPQASCITQNLAHAIEFDEFANFESPILFELAPKAKLTDILSQAAISAHGFLLNQKVKDILSGFNLMPHRYYKCIVRDSKGINHDYYWLHISDYSVLEKINYPDSKFHLRESGFREKDIELSSYEDYEKQKKSLGILYTIQADKIVFKEDFNSLLDLFVIPIFTNKIAGSNTVKEGILSHKITGILMKEYPVFLEKG